VTDRLDTAAGRDLHRPADRQTLRVAAVELRQRGLTDRDIGAALRLTDAAVRDMLGEEVWHA
jgi:hypothetical protein